MMKLLLAVVLGAGLAGIGSVGAQLYPVRPLTMVVPFAAGGPNDAIARTLAERMQASLGQAAPDIPTVDQAGFPGLYSSVWFGFWAPARTPSEIIARLNSATVEALADPAVRARLNDLAQEIFPREQQTPEALAAHQKAEIDKWWPIIKAAGIKGE
jgi:tripartite-type tricarboxylate transporter receptor subunit TctC